ncbi:hypothetical protein DICPUDRAFT_74285 [Dictyostelium purpureum]|uniref:Uncharacterized protein n=1 Tax=Dictyostelium purpureum TaxID=5786 RepID=F0Z7A5_DICPU|nr:uncharacterized protein DICPUDRAFT_74285 [Dictyostelium purpureum]EGC40107.1 hypothetical protein DICPUDRAFT_74285 [Dictyostelium purpureum]|eukprot:XP_003283297.1 hypothetical protein DICPUDRAFT_74285 [Dictyostelium purpureum]
MDSKKNIIFFKNTKDSKINIKLQEWLKSTLDKNEERACEFFGSNYDQLLLEPLSVQIEKILNKLNQVRIYFDIFLNNLQNDRVINKLDQLNQDLLKLSEDLIDSKSNCLKNINQQEITSIIQQKHSLSVGLARVGGSISLFGLASLSSDTDPKAVKSSYISYHKIFWIARNLDISIRNLYSLFEDNLNIVLNKLSIIYEHPMDLTNIKDVYDSISKFSNNLEIEVVPLGEPPSTKDVKKNASLNKLKFPNIEAPNFFQIPIFPIQSSNNNNGNTNINKQS